jgi:hypothetical protein
MKKFLVVVAAVAVVAVFVIKADDYGKSDAEKAFEEAAELYERAETAANCDDIERQRHLLTDANAKLDYVLKHLDDLTSDVDRGEAELLRAKVVLGLNQTDPDTWEYQNPFTLEVLHHASRAHWTTEESVQGNWLDDAVIQSVSRSLPLPGGGGYLTVIDPSFRGMIREVYEDNPHNMMLGNYPRWEALDLLCEVPRGTKQITRDEFWDRIEAVHKEKGCGGAANISPLDVEW